jgi:hypothetical protein
MIKKYLSVDRCELLLKIQDQITNFKSISVDDQTMDFERYDRTSPQKVRYNSHNFGSNYNL